MIPIKCDYCGAVALTPVSNCSSCGGALPHPEVVEEVVTREFRVTTEMLDVTSWADTTSQYIPGRKDARLNETVIRRERIK